MVNIKTFNVEIKAKCDTPEVRAAFVRAAKGLENLSAALEELQVIHLQFAADVTELLDAINKVEKEIEVDSKRFERMGRM
ncbi:MAG: hypothetical protein IJH37_13120 [Clostridia bacterium]|nr:hypothetical protein [Clostridia bacterium]